MKENVIYGVSALQALWLVLPLQRKSLNPLSTRTLLSFKYIHSRIVFMFAWWGQRAKICWTSSLHAHVCLSLSLSWRVLPCPNIRLGAGLDAGNSAVRLSCIALPTLSCHVTVFALHLPLPVSVTSPLALPQAARPSAIHGNNFILLPLVGSRRDVQVVGIGHAYCMPTWKNTATPFDAASTQECWWCVHNCGKYGKLCESVHKK